jgi:hypothetical protein
MEYFVESLIKSTVKFVAGQYFVGSGGRIVSGEVIFASAKKLYLTTN